jgi:hypothetical protein
MTLRAEGRTSVSIGAALKRSARAVDARLKKLRQRNRDAGNDPEADQ